jgi:hypothetical protein
MPRTVIGEESAPLKPILELDIQVVFLCAPKAVEKDDGRQAFFIEVDPLDGRE